MNNYYKRLRKQLPHRYTQAISNRAKGITPRQVKGVFNGEITNLATVGIVRKAAMQVIRETEREKLTLLRFLKKSRVKSSKKAA